MSFLHFVFQAADRIERDCMGIAPPMINSIELVKHFQQIKSHVSSPAASASSEYCIGSFRSKNLERRQGKCRPPSHHHRGVLSTTSSVSLRCYRCGVQCLPLRRHQSSRWAQCIQSFRSRNWERRRGICRPHSSHRGRVSPMIFSESLQCYRCGKTRFSFSWALRLLPPRGQFPNPRRSQAPILAVIREIKWAINNEENYHLH